MKRTFVGRGATEGIGCKLENARVYDERGVAAGKIKNEGG